jgi:hypothetical protein
MSRNILVPDSPAQTESDTTEAEGAVEEQSAVNEAPEGDVVAEESQAPAIPDKYQGKSMEEVIDMHMNAEKEIGRQANEVGTYRDLLKSMSDATNANAPQTDTTEEVKPVEVSSDDLWDNPTGAIRSVVEDAVKELIAPVQQSQHQQQLEAQVGSLLQEHPDAEKIGADPDFQAFVEKSPYRLMDAQRWVEQRDVDAARRLLSDWKELHPGQAPTPVVETEQSAVRKARAVATETGRGSGGPKGQDTLSKRDVMKTFINDRDLYDSDSFQQKLLAHARRGTLVD